MTDKPGIIVLGANGRMGRTICALVQSGSTFRLAGLVDVESALPELTGFQCPVSSDLGAVLPQAKDAVIIDFTAPAATLRAATTAAACNLPMVIGTTGFNQGQKDVLAGFANEIPMLWSANMSIGVNVLMAILPELARALGPDYDIEINEIHHRKKKDAPSGTALMLAGALARARGWDLSEVRNSCRDGLTGARDDREIGVQALRGGDVVGIHDTYFLGPGEIIEVRHQAESRENFAQGALRAAAWLRGMPAGRLYSMRDVINDTLNQDAALSQA